MKGEGYIYTKRERFFPRNKVKSQEKVKVATLRQNLILFCFNIEKDCAFNVIKPFCN